jgi:hypothetical protein
MKKIIPFISKFAICLFLFIFWTKNAAAEYGFSLEAGMNIPNAKNFFQDSKENIKLSDSESESQKESATSSASQLLKSKWGSYFIQSELFYNSFTLRPFFRMNQRLSGQLVSQDSSTNASAVSQEEATQVKEFGLGGGLRWFKSGGRPHLYLLGGLTAINYEGFSGNLSGTSYYYTLILKFAPSWQITESWDWGLDFELTLGQLFRTQHLKINGEDPFKMYSPNEDSGFMGALNMGFHFYYIPLGIYFQTKVRQRYFDTVVKGPSGNKMAFSNSDMAYLEFSVGYFFSRPKHNFE